MQKGYIITEAVYYETDNADRERGSGGEERRLKFRRGMRDGGGSIPSKED